MRLGTTAIILACIGAVSKIMGFAEKLVIANYFGTTVSADIYFATTGILFSATLVVKELIYPCLMTTLNSAVASSPKEYTNLFRNIFLAVALLLLVIGIVSAVFMPQVIHALLPGFTDQENNNMSSLLRQLLPAGLLMGVTSVTVTTLNAKGQLVIVSLADAVFKLIIVFGAAIVIPVAGLYAIPPIILTAAIISMGIQLVALELPSRIDLQRSPEDKKLLLRTIGLMSPIVAAVVCSHISMIIDNLLASRLPAGQLSYLNYGKKITDAIILVGPTAVVSVLYVRSSQLASMSRHAEIGQVVGNGLRLLLFVSVPVACLVIQLHQSIVQVLFQHGNFDRGSSAGVAGALAVYGCGLVAFSLEGVCVYTFYALSNTRTPVVVGVLCVALDIALAVVLVRLMAYRGIATALVIAKTVKTIALLAMLERRLGKHLIEGCRGFVARLAAATGLFCLTVWLLRVYLLSSGRGLVIKLGACCVFGLVSYVIASYCLGLREPRILVHTLTLKHRLVQEARHP